MSNLKDYATGIVLTAPSPASSGTSLTLESGQGARMPATPFFTTAHPADQAPTLDTAEKLEVTNVSGDTLTIVRAQGDTTAKSIAVGWRVSNALFEADIVQPSGPTSTDNAVTRFDGTSGKLVQDSDVVLDDDGTMSGVNSVHMSTSAVGTHTAAGNIVYNSAERTYDMGVGNNVIANLPEELWRSMQNDTGVAIAEGSVVSYAGSIGASGLIRGELAIADGTTNPAYIVGIATEDIANGVSGKITTYGRIRGIDTSAFANGDILFLSETTPGLLTDVPPSAPNYVIPMALVVASHAVNGAILVNPKVNPRVEDLLDVNGTALTADGQILVWDNTGQYFDFTHNINDYQEILTEGPFVDGDKTKLNGIEAGADVTDAANVAAAGAYMVAGTDVSLADGGTGASLTDPGADRMMFWDDSANSTAWLTASTGLSISGTNMTVRTASSTQTGIVELATTAETETGTDATRAVTPDGLHDMTTLAGAAWMKDEDDMSSNSATTVPSQQSVKAYVDGKSISSFTFNETPSGTPNGSLTTFTLSQTPASLILSMNGIVQKPGSGNDYTLSGNTITMLTAPLTGAQLLAQYTTSNSVMINGSNSLKWNETPAGLVNSSNVLYTTASPYIGGSLTVYINGIAQKPTDHYVETSPAAGTFTMSDAPTTGDVITVSYQTVSSVTGNADTVDGIHANATPTANTLYPLNSSGEFPVSVLENTFGEDTFVSNFSFSSANDTWTTVTDLAVTLPSAGTYDITLDIRMDITIGNTTLAYTVARLYDNTLGAEVPNTRRLGPITNLNGVVAAKHTSIRKFYTVTGPTDIIVQVARRSGTSWSSSNVIGNNDFSGGPLLMYRKIGD